MHVPNSPEQPLCRQMLPELLGLGKGDATSACMFLMLRLLTEQESPPAPLLALVHVLGAHHGAQARSLIAALIRRRRPSITAILALCSQPQPPMLPPAPRRRQRRGAATATAVAYGSDGAGDAALLQGGTRAAPPHLHE